MSVGSTSDFNRRGVLAGVAAAVAGPALARASGDATIQPGPIVETAKGKVRGYIAQGVHTFRGLRYGASTAGANRFKPPVGAGSW